MAGAATPRQRGGGTTCQPRQSERRRLRPIAGGNNGIPEMVPQMYKGVDERLWPAAERSVLAHLIDLEHKGRVARADDRWSLAA